MKWCETSTDYILESGLEQGIAEKLVFKRLDRGVKAFFIEKGSERRLYKIYFSRTAKGAYPYFTHAFVSIEECQKWLQTFSGKVLDKIESSQKVNRYEAGTLVSSLNNFEGVLETYKIFEKDEEFMARLLTKTRRSENTKKVKRNWL